MQKWLDDDILMWLIHTYGKLVVVKRFPRTLKCNGSYYHFIGKKPMDAGCSSLTEEVEMNPKVTVENNNSNAKLLPKI